MNGSIITRFVRWPPLSRPALTAFPIGGVAGLTFDFSAVAVTFASRLVVLACNMFRFLK
jgi:hypothetical protein